MQDKKPGRGPAADRLKSLVVRASSADLITPGGMARYVIRRGPKGLAADLRAAPMQADAAVRGAADVFTLGYADEFAAGADSLIEKGGLRRMPDRYRKNLAREQARDLYDARHRADARLAGKAIATALMYRAGARGGAGWSNALPNKAKGDLGEAMSMVKTVARGDLPKKAQVRVNLPSRGYTRADHTTHRGATVEAKFGPTARLSNPQQRAVNEIGKYRVDWWLPKHVGRVSGSLVGGASAADTVARDRRSAQRQR